jgi:hypothetical protein
MMHDRSDGLKLLCSGGGLLSIAAMLLLSACSLAPSGGEITALATTAVETAAADRKAYNDQKAETLLTLPCDISVGAYFRLNNTIQQEALAMLCSGRRPGQTPPELN